MPTNYRWMPDLRSSSNASALLSDAAAGLSSAWLHLPANIGKDL